MTERQCLLLSLAGACYAANTKLQPSLHCSCSWTRQGGHMQQVQETGIYSAVICTHTSLMDEKPKA